MKVKENLSLGNKKAYQTHSGFGCEKENKTGLVIIDIQRTVRLRQLNGKQSPKLEVWRGYHLSKRKGHLFYRNLNCNIWIFIHIIAPVTWRYTEFSSIKSFLNLICMHFFMLFFSIGFFRYTICPFLFLTFDNDDIKSSKRQVDSLLIYPSTWFILHRPRLLISFSSNEIREQCYL